MHRVVFASLLVVVAVLSSPMAKAVAVKEQPAEGADDFYASLKRAVDTVEGHPPARMPGADLDTMNAIGYIRGVWDGMKLEAEAAAPGSSSCMASPIQSVGMARIVLRYMDTHPTARAGTQFSVVASAYRDAYPCVP